MIEWNCIPTEKETVTDLINELQTLADKNRLMSCTILVRLFNTPDDCSPEDRIASLCIEDQLKEIKATLSQSNEKFNNILERL